MEDTYDKMGIVFKELGDFFIPGGTAPDIRLNPSAELMWLLLTPKITWQWYTEGWGTRQRIWS